MEGISRQQRQYRGGAHADSVLQSPAHATRYCLNGSLDISCPCGTVAGDSTSILPRSPPGRCRCVAMGHAQPRRLQPRRRYGNDAERECPHPNFHIFMVQIGAKPELGHETCVEGISDADGHATLLGQSGDVDDVVLVAEERLERPDSHCSWSLYLAAPAAPARRRRRATLSSSCGRCAGPRGRRYSSPDKASTVPSTSSRGCWLRTGTTRPRATWTGSYISTRPCSWR